MALKKKIEEWGVALAVMKEQIALYQQINFKALEYEKRRASSEYGVASNITRDIRKEFMRIFEKHGPKATESSLRPSKFLETMKNEGIDEAYKAIDPRLIPLRNMYHEFEKINDKYLSKDLPAYGGYTQDLWICAQKHLHESIIHLSNKPAYIQWLRKYILVPLQKCITKILGKTENGEAPTFFASKTEKSMFKALKEAKSPLEPMPQPKPTQ